jgi:voltage-gated potassium channel
MTKNTEIRVTDWMSFVTFVRHFQHYCFVLRGILLAQFSLVVLLGVLFAWCESIPIGQGVYFSLITATTAGLGDIAPKTGIGQCLAVSIAYLGIILFGLVVAVATRAFGITIDQYLGVDNRPDRTP